MASAIPIARAEASSTLDEDAFGGERACDGAVDTCWCSDGGSPQTLTLHFDMPLRVAALELVFAGGFVGLDVDVAVADGAGGWAPPGARLQPRDVNDVQRFDLPEPLPRARAIRVTFGRSTDFFGRVTLYRAAACAVPEG